MNEDLSHKMANTIDANKRLQKTYTPLNTVAVRRVDDARAEGRKALRKKKTATAPDAKIVPIKGGATSGG